MLTILPKGYPAPERPSNLTVAVFGASVLLLSGATAALSQAPPEPLAQHAPPSAAGQSKQLEDQVTELRAQVARLEAAVHQAGSGRKTGARPGMSVSPAPKKGMSKMGDRNEMGMAPGSGMSGMPPPAPAAAMPAGGGGMGMMDDNGGMGAMPPGGKPPMPAGGGGMGMMDDKGEMGAMPPGGSSPVPSAPAPAMGMCCMGEMGGMSGGANGGTSGMPVGAAPGGGTAAMTMSAPPSAMPGQPGTSHLYHVGSTGFFLNHSKHITLTPDQKLTLSRLKERAMLDRASAQRKIDQAEQELYTLTGADQLDTPRVQTKISEIERLRAEQRLSFVRTVAEAANALTHDQHQALMGTMAAGKP